jgi:transcriptional regulator with XRE-family HTH domain
MRHFGTTLQNLAKQKGWTQADLGQRVGMDPATISRIQNAKIAFSPEAAGEILKAFDDPQEREDLLRSLVRDLLVQLQLPNDLIVPMRKPGDDTLAEIADPHLYAMFLALAKQVLKGDDELRTLLTTIAGMRAAWTGKLQPTQKAAESGSATPVQRRAAAAALARPVGPTARAPRKVAGKRAH